MPGRDANKGTFVKATAGAGSSHAHTASWDPSRQRTSPKGSPSGSPSPRQTPGALKQLRTTTAASHRALEQHTMLAALTDGTLSPERYAAILQRFHAFHTLMEPALAPWVVPMLGESSWQVRRRVSLLEADLGAIAVAPSPHVAGFVNPSIPTTSAEALGCLYVVDGSTLGGQLIARKVRELMGPDTPIAYFSSEGRDVGETWRETCQLLEESLLDPQPVEEACNAAVATFDALGSLFAR